MAYIFKHYGGGCEAIIRQVGNELLDEDVHMYYCSNRYQFRVFFQGDVSKLVCAEHADKFAENNGYIGKSSIETE